MNELNQILNTILNPTCSEFYNLKSFIFELTKKCASSNEESARIYRNAMRFRSNCWKT